MRVFIAEKPELAKAIVAGLGGGQRKKAFYTCANGDRVTWCVGHLLELCDPAEYDPKYNSWSLQHLPFYYYPVKHRVRSDLKDHTKQVISLIKKATTIVHAGDPDREGQLIVDQLLHFAGYKGKVLRFLTNDNTLSKIKAALNKMVPNSNYEGLSNAGKARQIADQLYGFNMTMALTSMYQKQDGQKHVSVGRVQTPILGLVVNRTLANKNHESSFYYVIKGVHESGINVTFKPPEDYALNDKGNMIDEDQANKIYDEIKAQDFKIVDIVQSEKKQNPPLPFNIIALQIECAKSLGLMPDKVMAITQTLREKHALITYNGTDCRFLNEVHHKEADSVFAAAFSYLPELKKKDFDLKIKGKCFNDKKVTAHHAIIPTANHKCDFSTLSENERAVYEIIATQYALQFFPPAEYTEKKLVVASEQYEMTVTLKYYTKLSFLELTNPDSNTEDKLAMFAIGMDFPMSIDLNKNKTKPPKLYTIQTLLNDLTQIAKYVANEKLRKVLVEKDKGVEGENGGIGTSRTRDVMIKGLIKNGFIKKAGKSIMATDKAIKLITQLPASVTQPDMTALWHEQLIQVEKGGLDVKQFLDYVFGFIDQQIKGFKENGFEFSIQQPPCPKCNSNLKRLYSKKNKGHFWVCSSDSCDYSCSDKNGKPEK